MDVIIFFIFLLLLRYWNQWKKRKSHLHKPKSFRFKIHPLLLWNSWMICESLIIPVVCYNTSDINWENKGQSVCVCVLIYLVKRNCYQKEWFRRKIRAINTNILFQNNLFIFEFFLVNKFMFKFGFSICHIVVPEWIIDWKSCNDDELRWRWWWWWWWKIKIPRKNNRDKNTKMGK